MATPWSIASSRKAPPGVDHDSVDVAPEGIRLGFAESAALGVAASPIVTGNCVLPTARTCVPVATVGDRPALPDTDPASRVALAPLQAYPRYDIVGGAESPAALTGKIAGGTARMAPTMGADAGAEFAICDF